MVVNDKGMEMPGYGHQEDWYKITACIDKARFINKSSVLNIITCNSPGKPTSKLKQIFEPLRDGGGR